MVSHIITDKVISVVVNGKATVVDREAPIADKLLDAIRNGANDAEVEACLSLANAVERYTLGNVIVEGGQAFYKGEPVAAELSHRLLACLKDNIPYTTLLAFIENLYRNPSKRAIQELYKFLEHESLPLTPSGHCIMYKAIKHNWTDKHTGKFDNSIGKTLEIPRQSVDDDAWQGCSYGMHCGALEYVQGFANGYGAPDGDRIVIVDVDPADVVCVPFDCSFQKVRVCRYTVLAEFTGPLPSSAIRNEGDVMGSLDDDDRYPGDDDDSDDADADDNEMVTTTAEELEDMRADAKAEERENILSCLRDLLARI